MNAGASPNVALLLLRDEGIDWNDARAQESFARFVEWTAELSKRGAMHGVEGLMRQGKTVRKKGAALVIDYGHTESAAGDTFQAVGRQTFTNPLQSPGTVDLTAHVDFQALGHAAQALGADIHGPVDQSRLAGRFWAGGTRTGGRRRGRT